MGNFKGRNAVACTRCHSQKLKCPGGDPCQRCQRRKAQCVYPKREKFVSVPEGYLRSLESEVQAARAHAVASVASDSQNASTSQAAESSVRKPSITMSQSSGGTSSSRAQKLEDCSAEGFVQKLKELSTEQVPHDQNNSSGQSTPEGCYTYSRLKFDIMQPGVSFKLPPRPYALYLLQVFEEGFCDYHWYLRKQFRERLDLTYSDPASQSADRNWLCRLSVVMALAETWVNGRTKTNAGTSPASETHGPGFGSQDMNPSPPLPPGSDFFEQGLLLLKTSSEEPNTEDVEALNLIAFYCYTLNRRKTAYFYASQSVALAKLLHLDKPRFPRHSSSHHDGKTRRLQNEHRKRLWWTAYTMDRITTTELALNPNQTTSTDDVSLPSSHDLSADELEEFFEGHVLSAQVQLCEIKRIIANTVTSSYLRDMGDAQAPGILRPPLEALQSWRHGMPPHMDFSFHAGIPAKMMELPFARVLASLYLRYHQCFILLLRPFFLQDLASIVHSRGKDSRQPQQDVAEELPSLASTDQSIQRLKIQCVNAARDNCKILLGLCDYGKIAKFGYWESTHLFSGLAILCLARVTFAKSQDSEGSTDTYRDCGLQAADADLYAEARSLLEEMARIGNPASKDHETLLSYVESRVNGVATGNVDGSNKAEELWDQNFSATELDFGGALGDANWANMDWESLLAGYTQGL